MKLSDELSIVTGMIEEAKADVIADRSAAAENNISNVAWPTVSSWGVEKTLSHVLKLLEGIKADALKVEKRLQRHDVDVEPEAEEKPVGRIYS